MAAPSAAAAEARAALRALLRAVDAHLTRVAGNTMWRDHAIAAFRRPLRAGASGDGGGRGSEELARRVQLARDYAGLITNIAHHRELLASYNLGVDPDERNRRMVEATARRVGFALPHEEKPPPRRRRRDGGGGDGVEGEAAVSGGAGGGESSGSESDGNGGGSDASSSGRPS